MYKYKMDKNKIYKKTLFKKKWKEIKKETYLNKIEKDNKIISETLNFNLFKFLNDKYEHDFYNGIATFGEPVKCEIVLWEENLVETIDGNLCGDLNLIVEVRSKKTDKILLKPYYKMFIKINKKVSKKLVELLFERAFSGTFENPWLEEEIYKEMQECDLISKDSNLSYCCDTCGKKCNSLKEFLSHLIENNHYDSILYRYRNYPEFKNIYDKLK